MLAVLRRDKLVAHVRAPPRPARQIEHPGARKALARTQHPSGPPKKRLLIWADTRNGIAQHDIGHAMAVIEELGYKERPLRIPGSAPTLNNHLPPAEDDHR